MGGQPVVAQPVVAYNPTPSMIEMRAEFDALYQRAVRAEPAITTKLQDISDSIDVPMTGLDYRIKKDADRAFEKYAKRRKEYSPHEAFPFDVVRYTYVIEPDQYAEKVAQLQQTLADQGFTEVAFRNTWGNEAGYMGINGRYETAEGQRIEIQFHTPESFDAKQATHADYEIERDTTRGDAERAAAKQRGDDTFAKVIRAPKAADAVTIRNERWQPPDAIRSDQTHDRVTRLREATFAQAPTRNNQTPKAPAPGPHTHQPSTRNTPTPER